jgi:hypothetical protein
MTMLANEYRHVLLHMEWADALIWAAVLGVPSLAQDHELRTRMHHFHSTQWAYLQAFRAAPLDIPALGEFPDIPACGPGPWMRADTPGNTLFVIGPVR